MTKEKFKRGDSVISFSLWSNGKIGIVNKTSNIGVHVKFENGTSEVFRYNKSHHMHSSISNLTHNKSKNH